MHIEPRENSRNYETRKDNIEIYTTYYMKLIDTLLDKLEAPVEKYEPFFNLELKYRLKIILAYVLIYLLPLITGLIYFWPVRDHSIFKFVLVAAVLLYVIQVGEVITFLNEKYRKAYQKYFVWVIVVSAGLGMIYGYFGYDYFKQFGYKLGRYLSDNSATFGLSYELFGFLLIIGTFLLAQGGAGLILRASRVLFTQKAEMEADVRFATEIQESILKDVTLKSNDISAYACSYPANELGGDFFVLRKHGDTIHAAIGDVSGHSFGAGILMTMLKSAIQAHLQYNNKPVEIMHKLNQLMIEQGARGMFATTALLEFDTWKGKATVCNAGHLPLFHYQQNNGELTRKHVKGVALGMASNAQYKSITFSMAAGDKLFLYSDGLTEIRDDQQQVRPLSYFERLVKNSAKKPHQSVVEQSKKLIDNVNRTNQKARLEDDATLIILEKLSTQGTIAE